MRLTGLKMGAERQWMLDATSDLDVLSQALRRQDVHEQHGLAGPTHHVLGHGSTPEDCQVVGPGRVDYASIPSAVLYQRMCELESLRVHSAEAVTDIFECLLARGFFVLSEVSEGSDKEDVQVRHCDYVVADL